MGWLFDVGGIVFAHGRTGLAACPPLGRETSSRLAPWLGRTGSPDHPNRGFTMGKRSEARAEGRGGAGAPP